jgi:hypothetical protein
MAARLQVLDEGNHDVRGPASSEPAHRSSPAREVTVISFDQAILRAIGFDAV